jgi:predicted enzyme related to lactoylglutathione lyase
METSRVRAVLFVKDLSRVAAFYSGALGLSRRTSDDSHSALERSGFELIVHQIPKHIADGMEIEKPPVRRVGGALRLDYPVESIENNRKLARLFGGDIDEDPPAWADRDTNFYLGHDPEGNQFGVSQKAT